MKFIYKFYILGLIILSACNQSSKNTGNTSSPDTNSSPALVTYQCPMKCQGDTTYAQAGQCPVCKMDLEKI